MGKRRFGPPVLGIFLLLGQPVFAREPGLVEVELKALPSSQPGSDVKLLASISLNQEFRDGAVMLIRQEPGAGAPAGPHEVLWSGDSPTGLTREFERLLKVGAGKVALELRFLCELPDGRRVERIRDLFLSVEKGTLFVSDLSFRDIAWQKLKKSLASRGISDLRRESVERAAPDLYREFLKETGQKEKGKRR